MVIKGNLESGKVFIGDAELLPEESLKLVNHSPTGFSWGYAGSGPAQLSLALLLKYTKDENFALRNYQEFKWQVIAKLPNSDFEMDDAIFTGWIENQRKNDPNRGDSAN